MQSANAQLEILLRGLEHLYTAEELRKRLDESVATNRPLRVKLGMDPTAPDLHLGHCVVLEKMRQFQDLGHKAVLIIGDYTALIGDPTGQNKTRPMLSAEEIEHNAQTYLEQAGKVLSLAPETLELRRNSEWLGAMSFADVVRLTSKMTVARMLERDTFEKRYKAGEPISLHEFLYPLCQGWDSVMVQADVELGGTDQTFNNLVGRELQRDAKQAPQIVMILPLLEGTDGSEKMSKSKGNTIGVADVAREIYGKTMAISDDLMIKWYRLLRHKTDQELNELKQSHPMHAKKALAFSLVERFHGSEAARDAQAEFESVFSKREMPDDMTEMRVSGNRIGLVKLLVDGKLAPSNSEARRLIRQGAVSLDGQRINDEKAEVALSDGVVLQAGKRKFVRIRI